MDNDATPHSPLSDDGDSQPPQETYRPFLVVKVRDGVSDGENVLRELLAIAGLTHPPFMVGRLFASVSSVRVEELQTLARRLDPEYGRSAPDLNTYFAVLFGGPPGPVIEVFAQDPRVELVYEPAEPGPPPALVTRGDNPDDSMQGYLNPEPNGIDAWYGWEYESTGIAGSNGAGIDFIDIEQGWDLSHADLIAAGIPLLSGVNKFFQSHGTSVLGIVRAVNNIINCVGIANECNAGVVSEWRTGTLYDRADAILDAVARLSFGDVLLIESDVAELPVEVEKANYDAIRLGSALGIVVVEPAGNGGVDLDSLVITWGSMSGTFLDRDGGVAGGFKDSGAIMVAAASSALPHTPRSDTSFGSRIDCYAWGENVYTLGGTASGLTLFGGTSGASAIVAGAALVVQGASVANLHFRQSGGAMRELLKALANSTSSSNPITDRIGRMPDLAAILGSSFGLTPDVYLRDHVGDTGDPHTGPISSSPDIIVRAAAVGDPQFAFGEGSGTENDGSLSDLVKTGVDHRVYVRVRNRGASATGAQATVYWAPPATLVTPDLWTPIGSVSLPPVPAGDSLTVSSAIPWPASAIPSDGHYCFVGLIGSPGDPMPAPADFGTMDNFRRFVRERNNATWRNFNVVTGVPVPMPVYGNAFALPFHATGPPDHTRRMAIDVIGRLPEGTRAWIEIPAWMVPERLGDEAVRLDRETGMASVPVQPHGVSSLGEHVLPERARIAMRLIVTVPEEPPAQDGEVAVRQSWRGEEVGRITWRIVRGEGARRDEA